MTSSESSSLLPSKRTSLIAVSPDSPTVTGVPHAFFLSTAWVMLVAASSSVDS